MKQKIAVVEEIMNANDRLGQANKERLDAADLFALNFMASPGAGKTSLIERTVLALKERLYVAVVDGDVATTLDTERAARVGATAVQINTGGECHLDAVMLQQALDQIDLRRHDLLIIENVGNLICPAHFKLGAHANVLIASVPEGDDKPYKYPAMYQEVDALVINKIDLLPYVSFDMDYFQRGVAALNPGLVTFPLSCHSGAGLEKWLAWVLVQTERHHPFKKAPQWGLTGQAPAAAGAPKERPAIPVAP
jgi:hydrogenase nickel incorporation protein HypB